MRACVIFNPSARGEKAKGFRRNLDAFGSQCSLKLTAGPGDARRLAAEAVGEGFDTIIAAGGDGTVNEVLNGIGDAPEGFERARLGVLPLGTVNVFAKELALPSRLMDAWDTLCRGREARIDLPFVDYGSDGRHRRYFAQLAGAGLDARAIEGVQWELKKRVGPMAYVLAGMQALRASPSAVTATWEGRSATGALVLIGNGRLYGGQFRIFPNAELNDGLLEICVFPVVNWLTLARCGPQLLCRGTLPSAVVSTFRATSLTLTSPCSTPFEVDGELIGNLPATFSILKARLRVVVP
jgi:diacylglycerol kinase (ATP)